MNIKLYEVADNIDGHTKATYVFKEDAENHIKTQDPLCYIREIEFNEVKARNKREK